MDWSDDLISLMASSPRIAKHAHVPMQSGSDAILRRMHRKYRPWHYREKIEKIRAAMPDADPSRWVTPTQVAQVIAFLLSDAASAVTGAALAVPGLG